MKNSSNSTGIAPKVQTNDEVVQKLDMIVDDDDNNRAGVASSRGGPMIRVNVSHGSSHHEVYLPGQSTFRDIKQVLVNKTALEPEDQRLFFRGKEKDDEDHLHTEGVKDKSKIMLLEDQTSKERKLEDIKEKKNKDMLTASESVAGVRSEVDKVSQRVAALEVAVNGGTGVSEKEFLVLTELLMRQLLNMDSIEAEGEAKLQRNLRP